MIILLDFSERPLEDIKDELMYDEILKRSFSCPGDMETQHSKALKLEEEAKIIERMGIKVMPYNTGDLSDPGI